MKLDIQIVNITFMCNIEREMINGIKLQINKNIFILKTCLRFSLINMTNITNY